MLGYQAPLEPLAVQPGNQLHRVAVNRESVPDGRNALAAKLLHVRPPEFYPQTPVPALNVVDHLELSPDDP